ITTARRELVDVESSRVACTRRSRKMSEQLRLVEREVRRGHDRTAGNAQLRRVRGKLDGVPGRLRTAVHRDEQASVRRPDEQLSRAHALLDETQEPTAGRAEGEPAVDAAGGEEIDVRPKGLFVERFPRRAKRGQRRG